MGHSLCDCVDIFGEWREKQGQHNVQLLVLAVLDKEAETPGVSWRVRLAPPPKAADGQVVALPDVKGASGAHGAPKKSTKPACMQVRMHG